MFFKKVASMISVVTTANYYSFNQQIFTGIVCILSKITVLGDNLVYGKNST